MWLMLSLILTITSVIILVFAIGTSHPIFMGIGLFIVLFFNASYSYTALINPGLPDRDLSKYSKEFLADITKTPLFCQKCKVIKDYQKMIIHCSHCDVCVEGYDHHCVWTSKCIGKGNMMSFQLFSISVLVLLLYIMLGSAILVQLK